MRSSYIHNGNPYTGQMTFYIETVHFAVIEYNEVLFELETYMWKSEQSYGRLFSLYQRVSSIEHYVKYNPF